MNLIVNRQKQLITDKLIEIFSHHIGRDKAISSEELFREVTGISPETLDFYERAYRWNMIKHILGVLRKEETLFVVTGTRYHYVLDSDEELESYKNHTDSVIKGFQKMKVRADNWVKSEKLKKMKQKSKEKQTEKEKKALKVMVAQ